MTGGYTDCACHDCFEIAIGDGGPALCWECEEAGCEIPIAGKYTSCRVDREDDDDDGE